MTPSQWLDLAILGIAFVAAVSGWRSGALGSLLALLGVVLGAVAGVLLAPHVVTAFEGPRSKLFVTLFLILALVVIGEIAGVVLGRAVRSAIRNSPIRLLDSVVGLSLQLVAVLLAAWMLGFLVQSSDQPRLVSAVTDSKVWSEVDQVVPDSLRTVPGRLKALLNTSGLPNVWQPFGRTPIADVDAPDVALVNDPVVQRVQPSVVKIRGVAPGCQKVLEGSGFVVSNGKVMSNAHVVAGAESVTVDAGGQEYEAFVVSYDPNADISILEVPELTAAPLEFYTEDAEPGTGAVVLGYPGGGDFTPTPARVRETIELNGPDIYQRNQVNRHVYTIRGQVKQGNSGGPMINRDGQVLGVVFGAAVDDPDTGFVLTYKELTPQLLKVNNSQPVATGACVS